MEDLIAKYLFDELTSKEEKTLLDYISKSPENAEAFVHSKKLLTLSDSYSNPFKPNAENAWLKVKLKALSPSLYSFNNQSRRISMRPGILGIAASIILVCGLIYMFSVLFSANDYLKTGDELALTQETQVDMVEIASGDNIEILYLPDSSLAILNKFSKLTYPKQFDEDNRVVKLEGESFFEVKRDPNHPFYVFTENTKTRVLGTSFNVKAYKNDVNTEVSVTSGKVVFFLEGTKKDRLLVLGSNDKATFNKDKVNVLKTQNENLDYLEWFNGLEMDIVEELPLPKPELITMTGGNREETYRKEKASPMDYLNNVSKWGNTFVWNNRLIKKTLVEGEIYNSAVLAYYHEITLKATFYDDDDAAIATEVFTVHEEVAPGDIIRYQRKLDSWYDLTSKVIVEIEKAEAPTISLYQD